MRKLYVLLLLMIFCVAKGNAQDLKFLWAKQVKTRNFGSGTSIITDLDKNVYTLGDFAKYGDFDPDEGGVVINENSEYGNIYLQKRNSAGKHLWVKQIKGTVVETHRVITDSEGNLYILGYFGGKIDIDLGEGENWLTSKNDRRYDLFILKLDPEGNTIWIKQMFNGGYGKGDIKIGKDNNLYMTYSFSRELSIIKNGKEEFFKTERDAALVLKMSLEGEYDWIKIFDGKGGIVTAESISTDENSNVYVSGSFSDLIHFDKDSELGADGAIVTYITKLDTEGNFKWAKKIDGDNVRVKGFAMANDQENNLYIAGGFSGKVDMDPNEGVHEVTSLGVITNGYVLKWSPKGEFIWAKRTRTRGRFGSIMDFALDSGGNSYGVGTSDGDIVAEYENRTEIIKAKKGKKQIFIQKIDANGKLKWLKGMNVGRGEAEEIHLENDSDLYVTGSFSETVDFDMNEGEKLLTSNDRTDPFTLKMSVGEDEVVVEEEIVEDNYDYVNEVNPQDLELTWAKQIKGADSNSGNYVTTDLNNNTYIVGKFANFTDFNPTEKGGILKTDGERDVYIQKRNSNGKHVWAKQIKGTSARNVGRVITDYENNIYIIGIFKGKADFDLGEGEKWLAAKGNSDIFILKLDPEGNTIWVEQISTGGSFLHQSADTGSIAIGTDNNLYVTGFFRDSLSATIGGQSINFSSERESVFILKMGLDGGLKWANQFEGKGATYANSLSLDQDNSIYISGHFTASVDFDPSTGEYLLKTEGKRERAMFIAKLDTEGNFKWAKKIKGAMVNSGGSLANDARNNLYVSGRFSGTIDINPNEGVYHLTALPRYGSNSFILKLTSAGAFLWATPTRSDKFCMLNEIVVDKEGYSYGLGFFSGTIKYGKEDNEKLISSKGSNQILIQKISPIGTLEWVKGIGGEGADFGMGLHIDNDYNLYATGSFEEKVNFNVNTIEKNLTSGTRGDTFVLKMSIVGDGWFCEEDQEEEVYNLEYVWGKQLKGDSNNEGESITTDCDGNVYVTGSFKGITDFDTYLDGKRLTNGYKEASDIYIQKLTPEGYHVWAKQIMGSSTQQVSRIVADADNNLYVLGTFEGTADFDLGEERLWMTAKYDTDVFVLKLDSDGNTIWAKQIGTGGVPDKGFMQLGKDNHLYVTSSFSDQLTTEVRGSAIQIASEGESLFALKMSLDGEFKWVKHFEGVASGYGTTEALSLDQDNNVYVAGHFGRAMDFDPSEASHILRTESRGATFITKLDKEGNFQWAKMLKNEFMSSAYSIANDLENNVYVSGTFQDELDVNPNEGVHTISSIGNTNNYLIKLDSAGGFLWAMPTQSYLDCRLNEIVLDEYGNSYGIGFFTDDIKIDWECEGDEDEVVASEGESQIFMQKVNAYGGLEWIRAVGSTGGDYGEGFHIDNDYNLYATGSFEGTVDFNVNEIEENLISGKERDTFILKLSLVADEDDCLEEEEEEDDYCEGEGEGVAPDTNDNTIPLGVVVNAYPNPTTSTSVTVNFSLPLPEVTIKVSDAQGRLLHNSLYRNANDIVLPLDDLKGLYFIEMITADAKQTISVVKK